ncbi:MAG: glycosyl transferase [Gammaproteobacteria bacterium]|jgi:Fuc2NAc and GlcNAc transferase|nr:glycosyl transferase [Gammaproteobacteria bacterium]
MTGLWASPTWLLPVASGLCVALLTWPLRAWLLRRRLLDMPEARRSHERPTPRGGGLAIALVMMLFWLALPDTRGAWMPVMCLVLAMAGLGWIDDRYGLATRWRLLVQAGGAAGFLWLVGGIPAVDWLGQAWVVPGLWTVLGAVAIVWLINLHNFMDGSDGLAAAQGSWCALVMAWLFFDSGESPLAALALVAAGAWVGFLFWNRPPARIFMGDSGSLALGALIAALAVMGSNTGAFSIWISLMLSSLFVVDATATLLWRVMKGERWYTAHRQHAYQRLLDLGLSHGQVVGVCTLVNVFLVLPLVVLGQRWPMADTLLAAGLTALLVVGWQVVQSAATVNNDKA